MTSALTGDPISEVRQSPIRRIGVDPRREPDEPGVQHYGQVRAGGAWHYVVLDGNLARAECDAFEGPRWRWAEIAPVGTVGCRYCLAGRAAKIREMAARRSGR